MMTVASVNYSQLPKAAISQLSGTVADNGSYGQMSALQVSAELKKTSSSLALEQETAVKSTGVLQSTEAVSSDVEDVVRLTAGGERRSLLSSTSYWSRHHQRPKATLSSSSTSGNGHFLHAVWKHLAFGNDKVCGQNVPLDLSNAATTATLRNERASDVIDGATVRDELTIEQESDDQPLDLRTTSRPRSPFPSENIPRAKIISSDPSRDVQQAVTYGFQLFGNYQSRPPATLACGEPLEFRPTALLQNGGSRQPPFTSNSSAINGGTMMTKTAADDKTATTSSLNPADKIDAAGDGRNRCGLCQKTFADHSNVKRHMLTHSTVKPFHCSHCGKGFRQNSHLVEHTRIHTGEKPYSCLQCGKLFSHNRNWRRHVRTHSSSDSYRCTVCDKLFCESYQLKIHERLHTGDKPFRCTVCDKAFRRRSNMTAHARIHQRDKPTCGVCGEIFNQSNHLNSHLRSHAVNSASTCCSVSQSGVDFSSDN